jgi:hypothetical protein
MRKECARKKAAYPTTPVAMRIPEDPDILLTFRGGAFERIDEARHLGRMTIRPVRLR